MHRPTNAHTQKSNAFFGFSGGWGEQAERRRRELVDLAALGGWKSTATILSCYQQPDAKTMRGALSERRPMESTNGEQAAEAQ